MVPLVSLGWHKIFLREEYGLLYQGKCRNNPNNASDKEYSENPTMTGKPNRIAIHIRSLSLIVLKKASIKFLESIVNRFSEYKQDDKHKILFNLSIWIDDPNALTQIPSIIIGKNFIEFTRSNLCLQIEEKENRALKSCLHCRSINPKHERMWN